MKRRSSYNTQGGLTDCRGETTGLRTGVNLERVEWPL